MNNKKIFSILDRELLKIENVLLSVVKTDIKISKEISEHIVLKAWEKVPPTTVSIKLFSL